MGLAAERMLRVREVSCPWLDHWVRSLPERNDPWESTAAPPEACRGKQMIDILFCGLFPAILGFLTRLKRLNPFTAPVEEVADTLKTPGWERRPQSLDLSLRFILRARQNSKGWGGKNSSQKRKPPGSAVLMADLKAVQWAEFWIAGKEEFIDRGPLVSAQYWGHEPGWLEPKETAGVETWTYRQVQPRSSGVCLGIIIAMTITHGGCTINQVQRGWCLTSLSSHENPVPISVTISKQLPRFALVCQGAKPVLLSSAK